MVGGAGARHGGFIEGIEDVLSTCSDGASSTVCAPWSPMSRSDKTLPFDVS
jgi:hypothetical protein